MPALTLDQRHDDLTNAILQYGIFDIPQPVSRSTNDLDGHRPNTS